MTSQTFIDKAREYYVHKFSSDEEGLEKEMRRLLYKEKAIYRKDLIQPNDPNFKTYYKEEWEKLEKEKNETLLKEKLIKEEQNQFYKDNLLIGKEKVKNALMLEDKIRYG